MPPHPQKILRNTLALVAAFLFCSRASAINKCVDGNGKLSYQEAPCASSERSLQTGIRNDPPPTGAGNQSGNTAVAAQKVKLLNANVVQEFITPGKVFKYELRPHWSNGSEKSRVHYRVQLLDYKGTELQVYTKYKDLEPFESSTAPSVLDVVRLDKPDGVDYKSVAKARLTYYVGNDRNQTSVKELTLTKPN